MRIATLVGLSLLVAACDDGPATYGDDVADEQVPARGSTDVLDWLDAGFYLTWRCEPSAHAARPGSGHGANRICSNELHASYAGSGAFPIGAAAVKEVFDDRGAIRLYAVYRKVTDETGGDSWYWFEGSRSEIVANGEGDGTCTGCHARAPQDFVYTIVR